jgi:dihydrofolate reductase
MGAPRRVIYSVAASLDGYVAGPNGEADWIPMDPDIDFGAIFARFDTFLMGRKTYEAATAQGHGGTGGRTIVFSRTLDPARHRRVTVVADRVAETVTALKAESGKDIWLFGGGILFRSLLEAGLVDTVEVAVMPVLLGGGIRLLPEGGTSATLRKVRAEEYPAATVLITYEVDRPRRTEAAAG